MILYKKRKQRGYDNNEPSQRLRTVRTSGGGERCEPGKNNARATQMYVFEGQRVIGHIYQVAETLSPPRSPSPSPCI